MKKSILFNAILVLLTSSLFAQTQLDNNSFESWEDVSVGQDEPVNWSSVKTSNNSQVSSFAPINWGRTDTAHSGAYALKLFNVKTIIGAIATGSVTNGRFHATMNPSEGLMYSDKSNAKWNTPLTVRPDSVSMWVQYYPQGNDTMIANFILHKDSCTIALRPDVMQNLVGYAVVMLTGTHNTWTKITVPFNYVSPNNPEFILVALTSGAGLQAVEGSVAFYDDVELIYNPISIAENKNKELDIYAADGTIYFKDFTQEFQNQEMEIYDLTGRLVLSQKLYSDQVDISSANLQQGVYIVALTTEKGQYVKRIFIK